LIALAMPGLQLVESILLQNTTIMDITPADKQRWEKTKSKGRVRFGLVNGIILGVFNYFVIYFEELVDGSFVDVLLSLKSWLILILGIVFFSFLFGWFLWRMMEKSFSENQDNKNTPGQTDRNDQEM